MNEFKQKVLTAVCEPDILTEHQCSMIRTDANIIGMKRSHVLKKDGTTRAAFTRTCSSCWVPYASHYKWLYEVTGAIARELNQNHYKFDITGMQQLQILRYRPGQFFLPHFDCYDGSDRKLTMVINLSDPSEFLGGGLRVECDMVGQENAKKRGSATMFPAYIRHQALPVFFGSRWVLVAWMTGGQWR
jgi:PKHD-type hydroxylase